MLEDGPGGFSAYVSAFGNVDSANEVVEKGAFLETLTDFVKDGWIAVNHKWGETGKATITAAREDANGLYIEAMFHSTEDAQAERVKMKERLERGKSVKFSIGYRVEEDEVKDGVRYLKKVKLYEASIVNVPANTQANAIGVKGALLGNIESRMALSGLDTGYYSLWSETCQVLYTNGITGEEAASRIGPMFDEFRDIVLKLIVALMPGSENGDASGGAMIAAKLQEITGVQFKSGTLIEAKNGKATTDAATQPAEETGTAVATADGGETGDGAESEKADTAAVEEKAGRRLSEATKSRLNKNVFALREAIQKAQEVADDTENFIKEDEDVFDFIKSAAEEETKTEDAPEIKADDTDSADPALAIRRALVATNLKVTNTLTTTERQ